MILKFIIEFKSYAETDEIKKILSNFDVDAVPVQHIEMSLGYIYRRGYLIDLDRMMAFEGLIVDDENQNNLVFMFKRFDEIRKYANIPIITSKEFIERRKMALYNQFVFPEEEKAK